MILETFRNQALQMTVYEHNPPTARRKRAKNRTAYLEDDDVTLPYGVEDRFSGHDSMDEISPSLVQNTSSEECEVAPTRYQGTNEIPAHDPHHTTWPHSVVCQSTTAHPSQPVEQKVQVRQPAQVQLAQSAQLNPSTKSTVAVDPKRPIQEPCPLVTQIQQDTPDNKVSSGEPQGTGSVPVRQLTAKVQNF